MAEVGARHRERRVFLAHLRPRLGDASGRGIGGSFRRLIGCGREIGLLPFDRRVFGRGLAQHLGVWFREAGNLVHKNGGIVDKFIGDALLAYWGGCESDGADCAATLRIARELLALAATVKWSDGQPFRVGVALHYGVVTCGNIGLDAQRDATIIGDAVNTVFRLESLMKELDRQILFSADFRENLATSENFIDLGERRLKGKQQPVRVYGLA